MIAPWPLTGRSAQLEELGRHYRDPARAGVVLHGPAGVGKTRLAEEALHLAERGGRQVERAVGHPSHGRSRSVRSPTCCRPTSTAELGVGDDERTGLFHARPRRAATAGRRRPPRPARRRPRPPRRHLRRRARAADRVADRLPDRHRPHRADARRAGSPCSSATVISCAWTSARSTPTSSAPCSTARSTAPWSTQPRLDELARLSGGNLQVLTELVRGARRNGACWSDDRWRLGADRPPADHGGARRAGRRAPRRGRRRRVSRCSSCSPCASASASPTSSRRHGSATLESLEAGGSSSVVVTSGGGRRCASPTRCTARCSGPGLPPLRLRRDPEQSSPTWSRRTARDVARTSCRWLCGASPPADACSGDRLLRAGPPGARRSRPAPGDPI